MITRRPSRQIVVGDVPIGGGAPIVVQSMTTTKTEDVEATLEEIARLEEAGCEIVRVAVPRERDARVLGRIRSRIHIPLIADIHFDYRLALMALDEGIDCLRLNPGNIGARERVEEVTRKAAARRVPIRIGVNAGSLERDILEKYGYPTAEGMVESALRHARILEDLDFRDIKISIKASSVPLMVEAYRLLAARCDYPLHLGVTEAGIPPSGTIKSAIGIGILLAEGIGDTIRVSLTADPVEEVHAAFDILRSLDIRARGPLIVACPTCGRIEVDLLKMVEEAQQRLAHITEPITVSILGCAVNGPGEAREADIGIAGGKSGGLLIRKGEIVGKYAENELVDRLVEAVERLVAGGELGERKAAS
ncbi:MAG: flavodoxin-dependent (E)-4-hydroxy-3-methylbut-2-enyl-diphosphate synthase [Deltaproteobacteria bacterium]|nr:MAG: flavodoxin-dependent (E)-4-hydroxy-3-methylbut-2-enyl-diphosphate synthase [Deltaproteobacteria bacterium]